MKYKVGDYVTIKRDLDWGAGKYSLYVNKKMLEFAGKTYKVIRTITEDRYVLDIPFNTQWHWTDDMLEDPTNPIYHDGDIVQTKNGNYYLVWNAKDKFGVRDCGHVCFDEDGNFSVVKVWAADHEAIFTLRDLDLACGELLWEKKTVKEMTVAEIEAKLGYSIKVVKE